MAIIAVCVAEITISTQWSFRYLADNGQLSMERRDVQSLLTGLAICLLLIFVLPRFAFLERLGPYTFTIYLYHVFGTSAMRLLMQKSGAGNIPVLFVAGVSAGVVLPVLLHMTVQQVPPLSRYFLGRSPPA